MISNMPGAEMLIDELLRLLDQEVELLERRRAQLERLSGAIVDRSDDALERLLGEIEQTLQDQAATDVKLEALRATLADVFACTPEDLKLSRLIEQSHGARRLALSYRRQQIVLLAEKLRRQHLETALLLSECARINHALLEGLFPASAAVTTYGARGSESWQTDTGLVDEVS